MQVLCVRITLVLPSFPKIDAFKHQLEPRPVQGHLLRAIRAVLKAASLQAFTPHAVAAAIEIQHLHLRAESNDIPHTDRNLSLLSIDGTRCMVGD